MSKTWLNKSRLSIWAYQYCYFIKDKPEISQLINESYTACLYCRTIEDRPEIRKYITDNSDIHVYRVFKEL